jgi:myo-inositol-1(or 4)-monophosphatase
MMGVVYDPTRDEMFTALAGMGAKLDGIPIQHPGKEKLLDCVVSLSLPRRGWARRRDRIGRAIRVSRNMGSAALAIAYLANGRFDAFVQAGGLSLWDICAAGLIAVEGGVRLTTLDGLPWFDLSRPTKSIALLGAAPAHHQTLLEMLA